MQNKSNFFWNKIRFIVEKTNFSETERERRFTFLCLEFFDFGDLKPEG